MAADGPPQRTAYGVFSAQSGALVIGPLDTRKLANSEADRLNGEGGKIAGVVAGEMRFASQQEGEKTHYVVRAMQALDVDAYRAQLEAHAQDLERRTKSGAKADREIAKAELERIRANIEALDA